MKTRHVLQFVLGVALIVLFAGNARAQCQYPPCDPGNPTMSLGSPSGGGYGHGKAIAIAAGAAAAVVVVALVVRHQHSKNKNATPSQGFVTGCTQFDRGRMALLDEKEKKVYSLVAEGIKLKAGERVELTGYRTVDSSGKRVFRADTLKRSLGSCGAQTAMNIAVPVGK